MRYLGVLAAAFAAAPHAVHADQPKSVDMRIEPRGIETPLLKYRLLPTEAELKPGNAVPILLRLPWEESKWMHEVFPTLLDWESTKAPDWAPAKGILPPKFSNEMKRAAFRRDASWEYPINEGPSLYFILLPDLQGLRYFLANGLSANIRYHLSHGELDDAREAILVGLANARHLAKTPFYINQLVAIAVDQAMFDRVGELIAQPNSPNLFWALSTLPNTLVELDRAASLESTAFAMTFPAVNELDRPRDTAEWNKMAEQLVELADQFDELQQKGRAATAQYITAWAKLARAELPGTSRFEAETVAAMSDAEAAIRWYVAERLAIDQRSAAAVVLRPQEAWPVLHQLRKDSKSFYEKTGTKPSGFFDATRLYVAAWSLRRKIDSQRIIEAVRHHLATHDGKLPLKLADIRGIPVPVDPMTDRPFHWTVDGKQAVLKAPSLAAEVIEPDWNTALANTLEYRLEVK
jgi:hypothetical protein